ncbi:MAG: aminopeptidase P family protein [Deltaproteobacteria bacterium]|nr:aminopeptidase P family protein [Deltaproteobacteria bacterium]
MKYNRKHATATWGTMAKDWEAGVNFPRLIEERFQKAQASVKANGLGAVLAFNFDNIRYITGTHIGEWCRDKMNRYAICPRQGGSFLFDPAVPAKRVSSPWMEERMEIPISTMVGALPPAMRVQDNFAKQIKRVLTDYGVEKEPLGVDIMELPMLRALENEGIEVVDGQQAMLDAREVKTADEIELLKQAAAMVDGVYEDIARAIRPGTREHELVALANEKLFLMGAERVECVNSVSGARGKPHSHTFSDRMIQPGDMVFLDLMHAFNGYRTCYYRTFICGQPNKYQMEAYETCSKWVSDGIDVIKPGATTADVVAVWPKAEEFGYRNEDEAFLLQYGHGIGLSLWERPILSRRFSFDHPTEFKEGMTFAVECWCGAADGSGAARIEEEVVVTEDGCEIITNYPSDHLISCGLPGCEVY